MHHGLCECEHAVWSVVGVPEPSRLECVEGELIEEETECGSRCTCQGGQIHCKPRCPQFQLPPDLNCTIITSPEDPCCSIPDCQMMDQDQGTLVVPQEHTETTHVVSDGELEKNSTHEPSSMPDKKNLITNDSMILTDEPDDVPNTDSVMKGEVVHATTDVEKDMINDTEDMQHRNKTSFLEEKPSLSDRPRKHFTSLNDLLAKHKQLGSFPLNTTTVKTPVPLESSERDGMLNDTHTRTPEIHLEAPHHHNASLLVLVDGKDPDMINTTVPEDSDVTTTNEESKTNYETSDTYDAEYSVDETHLQNNNNSESLLINGTISIFPNKVNVNEVQSSKTDTDLLGTSDDDRSHLFSSSNHGINESHSSNLPESGSPNTMLSSQVDDSEDAKSQSPPTYLLDPHLNISEILNAEYTENLHLVPFERKAGSEEPGGHLPLHHEESSYLPTNQEHHVNISEIHNADYEENLHLPLEHRGDSEHAGSDGYLPLHQESSYLPDDQGHDVNFSEIHFADYEENLHLPFEHSDDFEQPEDAGYLPLNHGDRQNIPTDRKDEWNLTEDDRENFEIPHHSNHSTQTRVETSYHVEYSDGVNHSGSDSPSVHEHVSHHSVRGEPPMNDRMHHLDSPSKNNLHDQSKGILTHLKRQWCLGPWRHESFGLLDIKVWGRIHVTKGLLVFCFGVEHLVILLK